MDHFHEGFNVTHRRVRKDPMPQIKDVAWTARGLIQNSFGVAANFRDFRKKNRWIQIALKGNFP